VKVELGAGRNAKDGFVTVDINPAMNPDYVASVLKLPFEDGTVESMRAVDVLEHLSYRHTADALAEWARVLCPDGRLYVQVPDADLCMHWYVSHPVALEKWADETGQIVPCTAMDGLQWRLLGGHGDNRFVDDGDDWRFNAHYSLWSRSTLHDALTDAGFVVKRMETNGHPNVLCWAVRT
jgi:SAM-dependent methyltransferase